MHQGIESLQKQLVQSHNEVLKVISPMSQKVTNQAEAASIRHALMGAVRADITLLEFLKSAV